MASYVARAAMSVASSRVQSSVSNAIGANNDEPPLDEAGGVKWYDFNWPPYIGVMHFDPWKDNIPLMCKRTASVVYFAYRIVLIQLLLNIAATAVIYEDNPKDSQGNSQFTWDTIMLSILQFVIILGFNSIAFYFHYRGIAGELRPSARYYIILESVIVIIMFILMLVDSNNVHGFTGLGQHDSSLYNAFCLAESSLWGVAILFTLAGIWRVWRYPGHTIAWRYEQPAGTAKAKSRKMGRASDLIANV